MIDKARQDSLAALLDRYRLEHDIARSSSRYLGYVLAYFETWLGRPAVLDDLNDDTVNQWIVALLASDLARSTVKGYRRGLVTLWRSAYENSLVEHLPRRVRYVKVPSSTPTAWKQDELRLLLDAAAELPRRFRRSRVPMAKFFRAFILTGFHSGLRFGDLRSLRFDDIDDKGRMQVVMHKTGDVLSCVLPAEVLTAIAGIRKPKRLRVFGDVACRSITTEIFKGLVRKAGLSGSIKWLRRSAATHLETVSPGSAKAFLGHRTSGLADRHYIDHSIVNAEKPTPPKIGN
jgi:integrase